MQGVNNFQRLGSISNAHAVEVAVLAFPARSGFALIRDFWFFARGYGDAVNGAIHGTRVWR